MLFYCNNTRISQDNAQWVRKRNSSFSLNIYYPFPSVPLKSSTMTKIPPAVTTYPPVVTTDPPNLSSMNIDDAITTEQQPSFLQTLLTNHNNCIPTISNTQYHLDMSDETLEEPSLDNFIPLSTEDKYRLYSPWK